MAKVEAQQREDVKTPMGAFKTIRYEIYVFNDGSTAARRISTSGSRTTGANFRCGCKCACSSPLAPSRCCWKRWSEAVVAQTIAVCRLRCCEHADRKNRCAPHWSSSEADAARPGGVCSISSEAVPLGSKALEAGFFADSGRLSMKRTASPLDRRASEWKVPGFRRVSLLGSTSRECR